MRAIAERLFMAKLHVFIDTNIFLSFFAYTNDDIEELKKLIGLIKNDKIVLYLTEQVCREFDRNRECKILQALGEFGRMHLPGLPRLMAHYAKAGAYQTAAKGLKSLQNNLVVKAKSDALSEELPADNLFAALKKVAKIISASSDDLEDARERLERGDPPGKEGSFGDRLNWEVLLSEVPDEADLHIISKDGDFSSSIDASRPHPVLAKEWKEVNKAELYIHNELRVFLAKHFPDIKVATDVERRDAINALKGSASFASTHLAISKLLEFVDLFSAYEVDELVEIAEKNNQVGWIGTDVDVRSFYAKVLPIRWEKYADERRKKLSAMFGLSADCEIVDSPEPDGDPLF
jgi:hypothetical protein